MSEVFVYVEGASDQLGMRELFAHVIEVAKQNGKLIDFFPLNGKEHLLHKGPIRAVNILKNKPNSYVFLVPDLYPPNKPFSHSTYIDLKNALCQKFREALKQKKGSPRLIDRFFVHCFKYDIEALILASEKALLARLGKQNFSRSWKIPVEDQNHNHPPKRIVEMLFRDAAKTYKETSDIPWILKRSDYQNLAQRCPQNFKPFIEDLFRVLAL